MKIKKGDEVIVITGKYKGVKGKVLESRPTAQRVIVAGVNRIKKHVKPTQDKPGHIKDIEAPIHVSNVALVDPKTSKPTRVGYKIDAGKKVRIAQKSGTVI